MTHAELAPILGLLAEACPGKPVTRATAEAYLALLKDLDPRDVADAATRHAAVEKWMPTPSDLRALVVRARLGIGSAEDVLAEVLEAIHDRGYNRPPGPADLHTVARAVVEAIGWQALCGSDNPEALRAHVLRIAASYERRVIAAGSLAALGMRPASPDGPAERAMPAAIGDVVRGLLPAVEPRRLPPAGDHAA